MEQNALERMHERESSMEAQQKTRVNNWVCSATTGGGIRCKHLELDTAFTIGMSEIKGIAEIPDREEEYEVDIDVRS